MAGNDTSTFEILIAVQTLASGGLLRLPRGGSGAGGLRAGGGLAGGAAAGAREAAAGLCPREPGLDPVPPGELLEVPVRIELRQRELDRGGHLEAVFPCLVTAEENHRWITLLRLDHSFHATAKEDLAALATAEIRRVLRARLAAGEDPLLFVAGGGDAARAAFFPARAGAQGGEEGAARRGSRAAGGGRHPAFRLGRYGAFAAAGRGGAARRPACGLAALLGSGGGRGRGRQVGADPAGAGRSRSWSTSPRATGGWPGSRSSAQLEERVQQVMAAARRLDADPLFRTFRRAAEVARRWRRPAFALPALRHRREGAPCGRAAGRPARRRAAGLHLAFRGDDRGQGGAARAPSAPASCCWTGSRVLLPEEEQAALRLALADALLELCARYFVRPGAAGHRGQPARRAGGGRGRGAAGGPAHRLWPTSTSWSPAAPAFRSSCCATICRCASRRCAAASATR